MNGIADQLGGNRRVNFRMFFTFCSLSVVKVSFFFYDHDFLRWTTAIHKYPHRRCPYCVTANRKSSKWLVLIVTAINWLKVPPIKKKKKILWYTNLKSGKGGALSDQCMVISHSVTM